MFRTLTSLVRGRRVRPVSTNLGQHGEHQDPSRSVLPHEDNPGPSQPGSSIVHVVQVDSLPDPVASGESLQEEVPTSANPKTNFNEVKVDLNVQNAGFNGEDHHMRKQRIVPERSALSDSRMDEMASCSDHVQSNISVNNTGGPGSSCTGGCLAVAPGQEQFDNAIRIQMPPGEDVSQDAQLQLQSVVSTVHLANQHNTTDGLKTQEGHGINGIIPRTISTFSVDSLAEYCRICQQPSEEPLMELGCQCRGELAKAHRSCIEKWFNNKGSNKCEVCQHVATNLPPPASQPMQNFWVWRMNGLYGGAGPFQRRQQGVGQSSAQPSRPTLIVLLRRHPSILLAWVFLLVFMTYLFVDVISSSSIGYAAMPIGFLFGVLVVLGLGTAARLIAECWHEHSIRRSIRRMEMASNLDSIQANNTTRGIYPNS